jgi:hypothetical protein
MTAEELQTRLATVRPHPRQDGPCAAYAAGHAALPGNGPAEVRAEMIAAGFITPDDPPEDAHGDHHMSECRARGCGWIATGRES